MAGTFEQCFHSVPLTEPCEKCPAGIREVFTMNQLTGYMTRHTLPDKSAEQPAQQADKPRAIIRHFAAAMERKLAANDATKGGWTDVDWIDHYCALLAEIGELVAALSVLEDYRRHGVVEDEARQAVLLEAADASNYLLMICDVAGALPTTDERGR